MRSMAMENLFKQRKDDQKFELPTGFRFHPSDEELINYYLTNKVIDNDFNAIAIAEINMNKYEPWDCPGLAKMGETEWYFYCVRDKKYPASLRVNRATRAGYWKATGKDKEIIKNRARIGMKKTLVFYKGRAPKGAKTNWVMHEYRLEGKQQEEIEWVVCRVYERSPYGKKIKIPRVSQLTNSSPSNNETSGDIHIDNYTPPVSNQTLPVAHPNGNPEHSGCFLPEDQVVPMESNGSNQNAECCSMGRDFDDIDISSLINNNDLFQTLFENEELLSTSVGALEIDSLWN